MRKKTLVLLLVLMILVQFVPVNARASFHRSITVEFNGTLLTFESPPVFEGNRLIVPMRRIFEAFGARVQWNSQTRTIAVKHGGIDINMTIDNRMVNNDGEIIEIEVPPRVIAGRTFVPLRFVGQALGGTVTWHHHERHVTITSHSFGSFEYMRNRLDTNINKRNFYTPQYTELWRAQNNDSYIHVAQWLKNNVVNEYHRFDEVAGWIRRIMFPSFGVPVEDLPAWEDKHTPEAVISSGQALPKGFANLFYAMATEAGFEAVVVSGYKRSTSEERPPGSTLPLNRHYWNAVKINEYWYLLDLSQLTGEIDYRETRVILVGAMRGHNIVVTPDDLIRMHFPDDSKWQLLENPLTFEQFLAQPTVSSSFVSYGIELLGHQGGTIEVTAAEMPNFFILVRENDKEIYDIGMREFRYPDFHQFLDAEGNRLVRRSRSESIGNGRVRLFSSIREPGTYVLQLLGVNRWKQDLDTFVEYKLIVR